jgi:glycosyltransferase involved in cell wall biosynthesis
MAVFADPMALDGKDMSDRNAAIWFSMDGFNPSVKGINGRRVAGESFVRGFLRNAVVDEYVSLSHGSTDHALFAEMCKSEGVTKPVRTVRLDEIQKIKPAGTLYYSSPGIGPECWRRSVLGATQYSICGITHTTATKAVMESFLHTRQAPQHEWDAIICTSRAVKASVEMQMGLIDEHLLHRFGKLPPRPQLPVIPLGISTADMAPDSAAGAALRQRLGIAAGDVVCMTLARLSINEKFDPLPVYIAMAEAQAALPKGQKLHMILCGIFAGDASRRSFVAGARLMMPEIALHVLDGAVREERVAALSGADIFLFPIDNIQETFGLAPVEAMAAGLPVIATDWDGLRDTVTPATGILVETEALRPELMSAATMRYFGMTDNYQQYLSQASALTRVNVRGLARAIETLARDPGLRARMGAAGQARARSVFDWATVIPQMQDFWAELGAIRRKADPAAHPVTKPWLLPLSPAPTALFESYPTRIFAPEARRYRAVPLVGRASLEATLNNRNYLSTKRIFESQDRIAGALIALTAMGAKGASIPDVSAATGYPPRQVERILIWLLKYHFVEEAADG